MSAHVPVGSLRHRLTLQAPLDEGDGAGGTVRSWTDVATLWARVEPLAAAERAEAGRLEAAARLRLTIRHRAGLTHAMRFSAGGRVLEIRGIADPDGRGRWLVCDCEEIVE